MYSELFVGFVLGVYFASHYDCKPMVDGVIDFIKKKLPKEKK